jgi:arylsulfatase A-like enzyme
MKHPSKLVTSILIIFSCNVIFSQTKAEKPNILFIMSDQWRRQALGFLNEDPVITPNLDKFVKQAVFFKNSVTNRPICAPSRATIFTGQYPQTHGVIANSIRLSTKSVTLGDIVKKEGYETAYLGKLHLDGKVEKFVPKERRHGFDYWITSLHHEPFEQGYYIQDSEKLKVIKNSWEPDWITDKALTYMDSIKGKPFCMVLSYGPPHTGGGKCFEDRKEPGRRVDGEIKLGYGYAAPKKWEDLYPNPQKIKRRKNVKPVEKVQDESWEVLPGYYGAISSIDENFGRIIDYLKKNKIFDNTIIVFTADHGEMLGSHGRMTKGIWFEEAVGIPCLISYKSKVKPAVISNPFSTVDMTPTILGLAGIETPDYMDGTNYAPALKGDKQILPDKAYCSFDQGTPTEKDRAWRAVYTDKFTYVLAKQMYKSFNIKEEGFVLYDKQKDPYQLKPIYNGMGYDDVISDLHKALLNHLNKTNDPFIKLQWKTDNEPKYQYFDAEFRN